MSRIGHAVYQAFSLELNEAPRIVPVGASSPLEVCGIDYYPRDHKRRIKLRRQEWRDMTQAEVEACDRLLDAAARAARAMLAGNRAELLALLRLVGADP